METELTLKSLHLYVLQQIRSSSLVGCTVSLEQSCLLSLLSFYILCYDAKLGIAGRGGTRQHSWIQTTARQSRPYLLFAPYNQLYQCPLVFHNTIISHGSNHPCWASWAEPDGYWFHRLEGRLQQCFPVPDSIASAIFATPLTTTTSENKTIYKVHQKVQELYSIDVGWRRGTRTLLHVPGVWRIKAQSSLTDTLFSMESKFRRILEQSASNSSFESWPLGQYS